MQPDNSLLHSIGEGSVHGQSHESSPYSSTLSKHWAGLLKAWIACGLVMAMLIGWQLYRRAEVSRVQWFHQECTNRAQVLEGEIQASLYSTGAFHGFVKTIPNFDEATFHTYVRHTNWTRPQTYAVIFLERVLHAQREVVEARIGHQFQMFAPDLNRYVAAKAEEEYAVLTFDPLISEEYLYFNFQSMPMHKLALEKARDTNEVVYSAPSRARGWAKFVAWAAVYVDDVDIEKATPEEKRAACRGYVGAVYHFKQLFSSALKKFGTNAAILVHGYDVSDDVIGDQGIIFTSLEDGGLPNDDAARATEYEYVVGFEKGFRKYELRCRDLSGSAKRAVQGAVGWSALIVIIVLLVGVIFGLVMKRIQAVELHVEEMRLAKIAAEAADRAKSSFIASVSHEIRTPMNGMIGMTSLLMETNLDATQLDYVRTAQASGRALVELVSDVLDLSKIEAGHMDIESVCFDPRSEMDDVLSLFADKARLKKLELAGLVSESVPEHLVGDPNRLRQVLINLVGNAIKFTKRGSIFVCINLALPRAVEPDSPQGPSSRRSFQRSPVRWLDRTPSQLLDADDVEQLGGDYPMLSLRPESRLNQEPAIQRFKEVGSRAMEVAEQTGRLRLVVSCEDTGVGIAPHVQPRLFKPFLQADSSTSREYGGTGIGLSISEKLVRLMGGTIRACSRYGLGTIFQFDVQLKMPGPKDRASLSPSSRAKEIRRNLEGLKVLVVDSNPVRAEITCSCVGRMGMLYCVEKNPTEALQAAKAAAQAGQPFRLLFVCCSPNAPDPDPRTSSAEGDPRGSLINSPPGQTEESIVSRLRSRTRADTEMAPIRTPRSREGVVTRRTSTGSTGVGTRSRARRSSEEAHRDEAPGPSGRSIPLPPEALLLSDGVKGSPELKNLLLLAVVSEGERIEGVLRSKGFAGSVVAPLRQQSVQAAVRQALGMAANQRADSAGRGKAQLEKWLKGKKVMVVDDTLINRRVAGAMLARYGCSVLTLASGQDAIDYLEKHWRDGEGEPIDLIFMDVQMPLMSGYETTMIIREKERHYCKCQTEKAELEGAGPIGVRRRTGKAKEAGPSSGSGEIEEITPEGLGVVGAAADGGGCTGDCQYGRIPVCAVTADVMKGTRERCLESGMTDYLPKPLDQTHLRATLGKVFGLPEEFEPQITSKAS